MRRFLPVLPALILAACQNDKPAVDDSNLQGILSYSREIRPLLVSNCLECHSDLPLHDPSSWDLLHKHKEKLAPLPQLQQWMTEGAVVDAHWATAPLYEVAAESVDDFLTYQEEAKPSLRKTPEPLFKAPLREVLTGESTLATAYLRKGEDTPIARVVQVGHDLLGIQMDCASCHHHPTEKITKSDYRALLKAFTMPEDKLGGGPVLITMTESDRAKRDGLLAEIAVQSKPAPADHKAYLDWLDQGGLPQFETMLAAYSFEENRLTNLALNGQAREGGRELIADNGVHGKGLYFDEKSLLTIGGLPIKNEFSAFTLSTWVKLTPESLTETAIAVFGETERGFAFEIIGGRLRARWSRSWPYSALGVSTTSPMIAPNRWGQVAVTWDGSRKVEGLKIYLNGSLLETQVDAEDLLMPSLKEGTAAQFVFKGNGLSLDELQIFQGVLPPVAMSHLFDGRSLMDARESGNDLRNFFYGQRERTNSKRAKRVSELLTLESNFSQHLVMTGGEKRVAFTDGLNQNLLARSLANQVWKSHFGLPLAYGLGFGDPMPKHPELLEWLANELVRLNWNQEELGAIIRQSKAWTREWQAAPDTRQVCPRPR